MRFRYIASLVLIYFASTTALLVWHQVDDLPAWAADLEHDGGGRETGARIGPETAGSLVKIGGRIVQLPAEIYLEARIRYAFAGDIQPPILVFTDGVSSVSVSEVDAEHRFYGPLVTNEKAFDELLTRVWWSQGRMGVRQPAISSSSPR